MDSFANDVGEGVSLRAAGPSDKAFLAALHNAGRADLRLVDGEQDYVEFLISEQQRYQIAGYGQSYPDAMEFIVEKLAESIGRVVVNFGANNVHVVDISLLPAARGHGYGRAVLRALQAAAAKVAAPLTLRVRLDNLAARRLYHSLGFIVDARQSGFDTMAWYPPQEQRRIFF